MNFIWDFFLALLNMMNSDVRVVGALYWSLIYLLVLKLDLVLYIYIYYKNRISMFLYALNRLTSF